MRDFYEDLIIFIPLLISCSFAFICGMLQHGFNWVALLLFAVGMFIGFLINKLWQWWRWYR
jgi:hypothetical protein